MAITTTRREFTRMAWASEAARAVWEPRVRAISKALLEAEVESVRRGLRACALQFTATPDDLRRFGGLPFAAVTHGRCVAAGSAAARDAFVSAWRERDDREVGRLLGFPACCTAFFDDIWNARGLRDTTLAMTGVPGPKSCNILGRWLGVRRVFHLPCGWACHETVQLGADYEALWPPDVLAWMDEILSWPALYSALHGVAIVTWPVMKVVTNTDYTAAERSVRFEGRRYPDEAPSGIAFPFRKRQGQAQPLRVVRREDDWTDNGFKTKQDMDASHEMIIDAFRRRDMLNKLEVLDLGAGNGVLLDKLKAAGAVFAVGVECNGDKVRRAVAKHRDVRHGVIADLPTSGVVTESFGVAMIAANRFSEMSRDQASALRGWLRWRCADLLVYSYDESYASWEAPCLA